MAKIKVHYNGYEEGKPYYNNLIDYIDASKKDLTYIQQNYDEIDSSLLDTKSFPINNYLTALYNSVKYSGELIDASKELVEYTVTNFSDAEEAIESELNKFREKADSLLDNISFGGFHFDSENPVYWEPGIEGYTAQGYTVTDNFKVISAYRPGSNSRLYYYDAKTGAFVGYVELNNQDHVGGTAYDPDHGLIFVTGSNGRVNCYDYNKIEQEMKTGDKASNDPIVIDLNTNKYKYKGLELDCNINIYDELKTDDAATINYHDGKLYVSTYRLKGDLVSYNINCDRKPDGKIEMSTGAMDVISHDCPSAIQGVSIFERNGNTYVAFSRSAALSPSSIDVYELNDDGTLGTFSGSKTFLHKGLEGVEINEDGSVTGIYEYEGSTSLDTNIDSIIDNKQPNPQNIEYNLQADFWNRYIHGLGNSSYEEAIRGEYRWF